MSVLAFINAASNLSDYQADMIVAALRVQARQIAPLWPRAQFMTPLLFKSESELHDGTDLPEGFFPAIFVDDPDVAGALGYHSVDKGGKYFIRIFVDLLLQNGAWNDAVSSCASHEFVEIGVDPACALRELGPARPGGRWYPEEVADPVESDKYPVTVSRLGHTEMVQLSNFVLPNYFDPATPPGTKVDYLGTCPGPFQLAPGGYCMVAQDALAKPTPVWGETIPDWKKEYKKLGRRALWK